MKIQRLRFSAWVVGFAMVFAVSSMVGTVAASAAGGSGGGASVAKAKAKAKHKKKRKHAKLTRGEKLAKALKACKKDKSKKKKTACEKAAAKKYGFATTKTQTKTVEGPGHTTVEPGKTVTEVKVETKTVEVPEKPKPAPEKENLGAGPEEKGGTKAIESASEIPAVGALTETQLNANPSGNWLSAGGGTTADRFSRLKEITPANVSQLKAAWNVQLESDSRAASRTEATPVEYEGVLYMVTAVDDIYAVSVASGKILWFHSGEEPDDFGSILNGGGNRGLAIGGGMIYSAVLSGSVEALNMKTGALEWRTELGEPSEGISVTSSPLYYNGEVIIGPVGGEEGVRGFVEALSAETGEVIWKHYNVPAPGEFGSESWPYHVNLNCATTEPQKKECTEHEVEEDSEWARGGAVVWFAPDVDPKTGLLYYGTSNAAEDYDGQNRPGADLWACAILAINAKTGELAWGFQEVHHDVWDADQGNSPVLGDVKINGKEYEAVAAVGKDDFVYLLNAQNGQPLPDDTIEEKSVPTSANASYPTQPIPKMAPFRPQQATAQQLAEIQEKLNASTEKEHLEHLTVKNGGYGETDVFSPTFLPGENSGVVYANSSGSGVQYGESSFNPETSEYVVCGADSDSVREVGGPEAFVLGTKFDGKTLFTDSDLATGYLTAYNLDTGAILWSQGPGTMFGNPGAPGEAQLPGTTGATTCNNGSTQTTTGLVFIGTHHDTLVALEASTGKMLWSWDLGEIAAGGGTAIYEWNGKEYLTVFDGEGGDTMWTFTLNAANGPAQCANLTRCGPVPLPVTEVGRENPLPGTVKK